MRSHDADGVPNDSSRRSLLAAGGAVATTLLGGCLGTGADGASTDDGAATDSPTTDGTDWQSVELETARSEEPFTIGGLPSPTIVHSFAVWCPKCERLSTRLSAVADEYTILGLNTDPNEDAAKVQAYAEDNSFGWRFAVAPSDLTDALVDEFGSTAINAPSTPVIVVCGDGTATFLSGGDSTRSNIVATAEEC